MPGMTVGFGPPANTTSSNLGAQGVFTPTSWVSGNAFATVRLVVSGTWSGTIKPQITLDSTGTNWLNAPGAQRLDVVSGSPAISFASAASGVIAIGDPAITANGTYEFPIPGTCAGVRAIMGAYTSGSATVLVQPSKLYVPGVPVTGVYTDASETGTGVGLSLGTLDFTGWTAAMAILLSPTTQVWTMRPVDAGGSPISGISLVGVAAATSSISLSRATGSGTTPAPGTNNVIQPGYLTRRFSLNLPAGGTVSAGRAIVEVYR
jgi:hypothetical protein